MPQATASAPYLGQRITIGNVAGRRAAIVSRVWDHNYVNAAVFTEEGLVVPRTSIVHESKREKPEQECWSKLEPPTEAPND